MRISQIEFLTHSPGVFFFFSFPLREQVRKANETRLLRLTGISQTFVAMDVGGFDVNDRHINLDQAKKLLDRIIAPETIELKVRLNLALRSFQLTSNSG